MRGVDPQDVHLAILDGILNIHQSDNFQFFAIAIV
jgi:hypothetical protein